MEIKFINSLSKKIGGIENLMIIMLSLLMIILVAVYFRLDFLINIFQKMCFYDYPTNYICSCVGKFGNSINLDNFSILP